MPGAHAVRVAVCVPWIDTGCIWRMQARNWTQHHWESLGVPVVYGTAEGEPVNRAAARNDAARQTAADVVVFADADTWINGEQFWVMVDLAAQMDRLIHGYLKHWHLNKQATLRVLSGEFVQAGTVVLNQPSGCIAVSRKLLDTVGGHDERFTGWGGEDRAFQLACDTLAGRGVRVPGSSYHLWHPKAPEKGRGTAVRRENMKLALRYKEAAGAAARLGPLPRTNAKVPDPTAMLELLSEPGGPLHSGAVRVTDSQTQNV